MGNYIDLSGYFDILDRAKRLQSSDAWMFALSQKEVQDEIIRLNTTNQLYEEGIRSDGSPLGPYRPFTIEIKRQKGQPYDHVTLRDTGDFYASFRVFYDADTFEVTADGDKGDKNLFDVYGDNVLGLTEFNLERIKQLILQYYAEFIVQRVYNGG